MRCVLVYRCVVVYTKQVHWASFPALFDLVVFLKKSFFFGGVRTADLEKKPSASTKCPVFSHIFFCADAPLPTPFRRTVTKQNENTRGRSGWPRTARGGRGRNIWHTESAIGTIPMAEIQQAPSGLGNTEIAQKGKHTGHGEHNKAAMSTKKVITVPTFNEAGFNALYCKHFANVLWIFIPLQILSMKILYNSFALTDAWAVHMACTLATLQSCVSVFRFHERISERTVRFTQVGDVVPVFGEFLLLCTLFACNNFIREEQRVPWEITLFYNCSVSIHATVSMVQLFVTVFHDYQKNKRQ
jgi:hypothetical protein